MIFKCNARDNHKQVSLTTCAVGCGMLVGLQIAADALPPAITYKNMHKIHIMQYTYTHMQLHATSMAPPQTNIPSSP